MMWRVLTLALVATLLARSALAVVATDGTATWKFSSNNGSTTNGSLTTTTASDLVVVCAFNESNSTNVRTVSTVTSTHLSFTKRTGITQVNAGTNGTDLECWTAVAASALTTEAINVTLSGTTDDACVAGYALKGLFNSASPWDTNASLPGTEAVPASTDGQITISTTEAHDMLIAVWGIASNAAFTTGGNSGADAFSTVASISNTGGALSCAIFAQNFSKTATVSGYVVKGHTGSATPYLGIVDAATADPPPSRGGVVLRSPLTHW